MGTTIAHSQGIKWVLPRGPSRRPSQVLPMFSEPINLAIIPVVCPSAPATARIKRQATELFSPFPSSSRRSDHRRASVRTSTNSQSPRKSSREESGGRKHSGLRARGLLTRSRSAMRLELKQEVQLVKRNLFTLKPWLDGFHATVFVAVNSTISVGVASSVALLAMTVTPQKRSSTIARALEGAQHDATGGCFVTSVYIGVVVIGSFAIRLAWAYDPTNLAATMSTPKAFRQLLSTLAQLLLKMRVALVVYVVAAIMSSLAVDFFGGSSSQLVHSLRLTVLSTVSYGFVLRVAAALLYKHTFPTHSEPTTLDSSESVIEPTSSGVFFKSSPFQDRERKSATSSTTTSTAMTLHPSCDLRRIDKTLAFMSAHVSIFFLYVTSVVKLETQLTVLVFSCVSVAIKVALQETTKHLQLGITRSLSTLAIHAALTVPTVMIDAQIRLVCMRFGVGQSVHTSSVLIVFGEMLFRTAKIMRLRHTISTRLATCTAMRRILQREHSKTIVRDLSAARAEYTKFREWRERALQLHAAEVYADMHGEYIALGCAIIVTNTLGAAGPENDAQLPRGGQQLASTKDQALAVIFQVVLGLAGDYVLSIVESVHEVPLRESVSHDSQRLRLVLLALLSFLAGLHVASVVAVYTP